MYRPRSQFVNFVKICDTPLCLFQVSTGIIKKFLTYGFNISPNITSLSQRSTIHLGEWHIQEICQCLDYMRLS